MKNHTTTRGVNILMGNPAKAVVSLAVPTMVASSLHSIYNLADVVWVAGLGADALAAVGFSFPFVFVSMALARGLGTGGGSAVSRLIGAKDRAGAGVAASVSIQLSIIIGLLASAVLIIFGPYVLAGMGARGYVLQEATAYTRISFSAMVFLIFAQTAVYIIRSEGEARGAMRVMVLGSVFNIVADPIFIYTLGMGVRGAALATFLANLLVAAVIAHRLFRRHGSYMELRLWGVPWRRSILYDIARVGIPSMGAMAGMLVMTAMVVGIASRVGGPATVAVYIAGHRIINIATMPIYGFTSAATAVCGAWYGANNYLNFKKAYLAALQLALGVQVVLTACIFVFAPYIARLFTWGDHNPELVAGLVIYLRIVPWMNPVASVGWITSGMFQGVGKGVIAMIMNILRTVVLTVAAVWLLAVALNLGRMGLWWGFVAGALAYLPVAAGFGVWYLHKHRFGFINNEYAQKNIG